ncbi:MAG: hypothetical protein ACKVW3_01825 [Phycisphaerales bacterium]
MDSTFVAAVLDSATVGGIITPWFAWIEDQTLRVTVIGAVVSLVLSAFRLVLTAARKIPLLKQMFDVWESHPKIVGPLVAILTGIIGAGSPLAGVLAAGLHSMGIGKVTKAAAKKMRGVAVLLALALAASSAHAATAEEPAVATMWQRVHMSFGVQQRWDSETLTLRSTRPDLQFFVSPSLALSDYFNLRLTVERPLSIERNHISGTVSVAFVPF